MTFPPFTLASASPRRRALLEAVGLQFDVISADIDESPLLSEEALVYVSRLAVAKAMDVASAGSQHRFVLAADTTVAVEGVILGKPESADEAKAMLQRLSGRSHLVHTGIALAVTDDEGILLAQEVVSTELRFRQLTEEEIDGYIASEEPFGKAGAYAVQGRGAALVAELRGSLSNVIGLPVEETLSMLRTAIESPDSQLTSS